MPEEVQSGEAAAQPENGGEATSQSRDDWSRSGGSRSWHGWWDGWQGWQDWSRPNPWQREDSDPWAQGRASAGATADASASAAAGTAGAAADATASAAAGTYATLWPGSEETRAWAESAPQAPPLPRWGAPTTWATAGSQAAAAQEAATQTFEPPAPPAAPAPAAPPAQSAGTAAPRAPPAEPAGTAPAAAAPAAEAASAASAAQPWGGASAAASWHPPPPAPAGGFHRGDNQGPQQWQGFDRLDTWVLSIQRWSRRTALSSEAQAGRVVDELPVELQEKLMHIQEDLDCPGGLEVLLSYLKQARGDREDDKSKKAFERALENTEMRSGETLTQFVIRRDMEVREARKFGLDLPEKVQVEQLKAGARLSEQNMINLLSISQGREDLDSVKKALMRMDVRRKPDATRRQGKTFAAADEEDDYGEDDDMSDLVLVEFWEDSILDIVDAEAVYAAVESQDLDEEQLASVVAAVLDEKREKEGRPRRWAEAKDLKRAMARDREFFDSKRAGKKPAPRVGAGKQKLSIEKLKARTRCANCGQRGHWRRECTNAYRPKPKAEAKPGGRTMYVTTDGPSAATWLTLGPEVIQRLCGSMRGIPDSWLLHEDMEPSGMVDTAAGQALVGDKRLERLVNDYAKQGWRIPIRRSPQPKKARGVGGSADIIGEALIPITAIPNKCVLIQFKIFSGEVPLLLPVKWLESVGAKIDLERDRIQLDDVTLPMHRESSGHRIMSLLGSLPPHRFEVDASAAEDWPGLEAKAKGTDLSAAFVLETNNAARGFSSQVATEACGPPHDSFKFDSSDGIVGLSGKMAIQHVKGSSFAKEVRAHQVRQRAISKAKRNKAGSQEPSGPSSHLESSPEWEAVGMMTDESDQEQDTKETAGQVKRSPTLAAWHRVVGRLVYTMGARMAMMAANLLVGEMVPQAALECDHPQWARLKGANQYAKYEHCRKCKSRLWIERRSRTEQIDVLNRAQQRRNEHGDRNQARVESTPLTIKPELVYIKEVLKKKKPEFETVEEASKTVENAEIARALRENNQVLQQMAE
ncbi:unnamed protein product, partial [Prorocentrum cordatum]